MPRRQHLTLLLIITISAFLGISFVLAFRTQPEGTRHPAYNNEYQSVAPDILRGQSKTPKLENATLKAELGNAAWKVLHTTMAKFPDKPTPEDSDALKSYLYLFARLYPCGDCARHFQEIMAEFPPQVSSRVNAATWACHVHNQVNKSLGKVDFDCSKIGDFYDCGCAEDETEGSAGTGSVSGGKGSQSMQLELEREEGLTKGG